METYARVLAGYACQTGRLLFQEALAVASIEYRNVWQERCDIGFDDAILNGSVFIGMDS